MSPILGAVIAALAWGTGNTVLAHTSRLLTPRTAVMLGFTGYTFTALMVSAVLGAPVTGRALVVGLAAGVGQGSGWLMFSQSATRGRISIAAPVCAITTISIVTVYATLTGRPPQAGAWVGLLVVAAAAWLLASGSGAAEPKVPAGNNIGFAIAAGVGFAVQTLAWTHAPTVGRSWVMVASGLTVITLVSLTAVGVRTFRAAVADELIETTAPAPSQRRPVMSVQVIPVMVAGGILIIGDIAFMSALARGGNPAIVTAVGQLHPLVTALAAVLFLHERLSRWNVVGIVAAVTGVWLLV